MLRNSYVGSGCGKAMTAINQSSYSCCVLGRGGPEEFYGDGGVEGDHPTPLADQAYMRVFFMLFVKGIL